jgi:feruloyl esterase
MPVQQIREPGSRFLLAWNREANWDGSSSALSPNPRWSHPTSNISSFHDPAWDLRNLNFDADIALADKLDNDVIAATDPDLRKFFAHGGKLILYHGWSDPLVSPQNSISYYKNVLKSSGNQAEASIRLFMAPGMDHCGGGEGPSAFDMDDALSQWVKHDKAPALIVAAHLPPGPAAHTSDRTRPLCAYPRVAKYKGTGSIRRCIQFRLHETVISGNLAVRIWWADGSGT